MMKSSRLKFMSTLAIGTTLALLMVATSAAQSLTSAPPSQNLVGTWRVFVQQLNCLTGDPVGVPFQSLLTFDLGGTMTETASNPMFFPAVRGPGHGVWRQTGHHTYAVSTTAFITSNGVLTQRQVITQTIEMPSGPNQFQTTKSTVQFFTPDDTLVRSGCAAAVGQRFQ